MDLLSLLHNNLSPAKKLESAILQNNVALLEASLQAGVNVDCRVQVQGGNTALHLASRQGYRHCVAKLLEYHADPDKKNDFNITSITVAFQQKNAKCLWLLLEKSRGWMNLDSFWLEDDIAEILWNTTNDSTDILISLLIKATPDFSRTRSNLKQNLFYRCKDNHFTNSLKIWRTTEDMDNDSFVTSQKSGFDQNDDWQKEFVEWLNEYNKTPKSLVHYARLVIRKSFYGKCNVCYGASQLPIPTSLKQEVMMTWD
ncbi:ankyrin repeat and SOCS box protein 14-like [Mizuhopecten yessoensis]|uniref:ankyrin repeat and SOCS box protein 14-like n=1 Tax=Mizuhopecten yessoensis TaxID=6573 RepID=UPI000B458636|nr:ankyrin repeat and SOCS box protein 14-like [Mizuhopecten yessoensis]